jgi:hypothetical protein
VSVGALEQQVGQVLGRAHALFTDPPDSGGLAASRAGSQLAGAADAVGARHARIGGLSGESVAGYGRFAGRAGAALDGLAGADDRLSRRLDGAAASES